ncbi:2623_t:CDS:2 [Funneliformis geosporum]|uniref:2623_t:CDS:1 n=1 Tax=Funneliformis geosporum TaxID=1117311 RepID=A0A9W4ST37_9GLOM|nr:2623_t:CDS:2 [Funneliformis geosporum]
MTKRDGCSHLRIIHAATTYHDLNESISSALYGLSSYLPTSITSLRKVTPDHNVYQHSINHQYSDYLPQQFASDIDPQNHSTSEAMFEKKKKDVIVYAGFDEIVFASSNKPYASVSQSVLMLGYPDGFQIWNVSSVDNIHELVSIRDEEKIGEVTYIKSIPNPHYTSKHARDKFIDVRPLVGLISISTSTRENGLQEPFSKPKSSLKFYSLKTHQVVHTLDFENEGNIVGVRCNERAIIISMNSPAKLHIISPMTLAPLFKSPLQDVALHPSNRAPIFTLGPRLLAYATTSQPLESDGKKDGNLRDGDDLIGGSSAKYQDVAKGVAKEVVNGVKFLGDYGYQTLSAYFANASNSQSITQIKQSSSMPINIPSPSPSNGYYYNSITGSVGSNSSDNSNGFIATVNNGIEIDKENGTIGAIIIRNIGALSGSKEPSIVAHFAPHNHHVGQLSFNPSGTLLFSTSVQGSKFHVFEILGNHRRDRNHKSMKHMYRLARGYTYASVGEGGVGWSGDSRWCAVASGKGTIHIFAINPYGGPTHIPSHISGLVKNVDEPYSLNTQSPVVRIKPRTPLPPDPIEVAASGSSQNLNNMFPMNPHEYYSFPPPESNSSSTTTSPSRRPSPLPYYNNINNMPSHHPLNGQSNLSFPNGIPINHFYLMRKPPGMCIKFLPSLSDNSKTGLADNHNGLLFANLKAKRQAKRTSINYDGNTSANSHNKNGRRRTRSWSQNYMPAVNNSGRQYLEVEDLESKQEDIGYQDVLSFHPAGVLTLHRIWMEGVVVGEQNASSRQGDSQELNNLITMAGTPLAGSAAAVANVGRVLVGGATTVVGMGRGITGVTRKEAGSLDMITNYEDVAEWQLLRGNNWAEVKNVFEAPRQSDTSAKRDGNNNKWLANAEISTHTSSKSSLPPPLWASPQFTFQTFLTGHLETIRKGEIPRSKKIEIRRDIVERVEMVNEVFSDKNSLEVNGWANNGKSNFEIRGQGRTSKAVLIQAGKAIGKGGDISESLSSAMRTSLDFSPSSPTLSAVSTKTKDRTSNGFTNGQAYTMSGDLSNTPLSFEDAYHIHIANNIPTTIANNNTNPYMSSTVSKSSKLNNTNISPNNLANNTTITPHTLSFTRSTSSSSSVNTSETTFSEVETFTKGIEQNTEDFISEEGNFFFSPDGDNEIELPSNSVIELQRGDRDVGGDNGIGDLIFNFGSGLE